MSTRSILLLTVVATISGPALAADGAIDPAIERRYQNQRSLGISGMVMGYSGPVVVGMGAVVGALGLVGLASESISDGDASASRATAIGGLAAVGVGYASAVVGPALLASGGLAGANSVVSAGGDVGRAGAWVAVGGSAVQLSSLALRLAGGGDGDGLFGLGAAGWATAMIAGTVQHGRNGTAWARASAYGEVPRKRVQLALVPTGNGTVMTGSF